MVQVMFWTDVQGEYSSVIRIMTVNVNVIRSAVSVREIRFATYSVNVNARRHPFARDHDSNLMLFRVNVNVYRALRDIHWTLSLVTVSVRIPLCSQCHLRISTRCVHCTVTTNDCYPKSN